MFVSHLKSWKMVEPKDTGEPRMVQGRGVHF